MKLEDILPRFENHVLTTILDTEKIKIFDFRNKDNSIFDYQRWIIDHGTLIVTKDNYNSIYKWNNEGITLKFLAGCGLSYFNEKCLADKDGSSQKIYDAEVSERKLKEIAVDRVSADLYQYTETELPEAFKSWDIDKQLEYLKPSILSKTGYCDYEFNELFHHENIQEAANFVSASKNECMFGLDGWEWIDSLMSFTVTPKFHLAALQVAYSKYPNAF